MGGNKTKNTKQHQNQQTKHKQKHKQQSRPPKRVLNCHSQSLSGVLHKEIVFPSNCHASLIRPEAFQKKWLPPARDWFHPLIFLLSLSISTSSAIPSNTCSSASVTVPIHAASFHKHRKFARARHMWLRLEPNWRLLRSHMYTEWHGIHTYDDINDRLFVNPGSNDNIQDTKSKVWRNSPEYWQWMRQIEHVAIPGWAGASCSNQDDSC